MITSTCKHTRVGTRMHDMPSMHTHMHDIYIFVRLRVCVHLARMICIDKLLHTCSQSQCCKGRSSYRRGCGARSYRASHAISICSVLLSAHLRLLDAHCSASSCPSHSRRQPMPRATRRPSCPFWLQALRRAALRTPADAHPFGTTRSGAELALHRRGSGSVGVEVPLRLRNPQ